MGEEDLGQIIYLREIGKSRNSLTLLERPTEFHGVRYSGRSGLTLSLSNAELATGISPLENSTNVQGIVKSPNLTNLPMKACKYL